jgi:hypothetical protein
MQILWVKKKKTNLHHFCLLKSQCPGNPKIFPVAVVTSLPYGLLRSNPTQRHRERVWADIEQQRSQINSTHQEMKLCKKGIPYMYAPAASLPNPLTPPKTQQSPLSWTNDEGGDPEGREAG